MQGFGNQFFAGAALAGDEHRCIGIGYTFNGCEYFGELFASSYDVAAVESLSAFLLLIFHGLLLFACKLLSKALKLVNKLPLIGKLNEFLGGVLGVLQGVVIALAVCWVLVAVTNDGGSLFKIITAETIEHSLILKTFATYNPLNLILSKLSF